jgi:uroporphyrinogen decarboxylase
MFSDILTPLTGMNVPFDILEKEGPVVASPVRQLRARVGNQAPISITPRAPVHARSRAHLTPAPTRARQIRTMDDVRRVRPLVPSEAVPYAGAALSMLRAELAGTGAAVLGFVGAPFTLATYCVEGGTTSSYLNIKRLAWSDPAVLHALLERLTEGVIEYIRFQADAGAHVVQIFDSWGCNLHPSDWDVFSGPYIKRIVSEVKATHPALPLILYANGSGGMLERMAATGVDCVSVDQSVDISDARQRLGKDKAVQGNLDPGWLFGSQEFIQRKVDETVRKAGGHKHVLNLGHGAHTHTHACAAAAAARGLTPSRGVARSSRAPAGVMPSTPEANVAAFFEAARTVHERVRM